MAPSSPTYVTPLGLNRIQEELDFLCTTKRAEMAAYLSETQIGGHHVDNTEYQYAYYAKLLLEARISELQQLLANAQLIEKHGDDGVARLGSTVTVQDDELEKETYMIVGPLEANPGEGLISNECPLGRALLDHRAGDNVTVIAPDGVRSFRLIAVS